MTCTFEIVPFYRLSSEDRHQINFLKNFISGQHDGATSVNLMRKTQSILAPSPEIQRLYFNGRINLKTYVKLYEEQLKNLDRSYFSMIYSFKKAILIVDDDMIDNSFVNTFVKFLRENENIK